VEWAAGAAGRTGKALHLVHTLPDYDDLVALNLLDNYWDPSLLGDDLDGAAVVERATTWLRTNHPGIGVDGCTAFARPERALIEASRTAHLVVVGSRPKHGLDRLLLGRCSIATAMHATCPVVVIREESQAHPDGPVFAATDGSPASRRAVEHAADQAWQHRARLVVVITWHLEVVDGVVVTEAGTAAWRQVEQRHRALAEAVVAPVRSTHPDLDIEIKVIRGPAAKTLVAESADASLLVLGSRGRGGFRSMLLGSVTQAVLESAECPVMVVKAPRD